MESGVPAGSDGMRGSPPAGWPFPDVFPVLDLEQYPEGLELLRSGEFEELEDQYNVFYSTFYNQCHKAAFQNPGLSP